MEKLPLYSTVSGQNYLSSKTDLFSLHLTDIPC